MIIQKIKNLLGFRATPEKVVTDNTLNFSLQDSEAFLKIIIHHTSKADAKAFASMLCDLHAGKYVDSIINTLLSLSKEDKNIYYFVKEVFAYWNEEYQNITSKSEDEEPLVKPSYFYKSLKHE